MTNPQPPNNTSSSNIQHGNSGATDGSRFTLQSHSIDRLANGIDMSSERIANGALVFAEDLPDIGDEWLTLTFSAVQTLFKDCLAHTCFRLDNDVAELRDNARSIRSTEENSTQNSTLNHDGLGTPQAQERGPR